MILKLVDLYRKHIHSQEKKVVFWSCLIFSVVTSRGKKIWRFCDKIFFLVFENSSINFVSVQNKGGIFLKWGHSRKSYFFDKYYFSKFLMICLTSDDLMFYHNWCIRIIGNIFFIDGGENFFKNWSKSRTLRWVFFDMIKFYNFCFHAESKMEEFRVLCSMKSTHFDMASSLL